MFGGSRQGGATSALQDGWETNILTPPTLDIWSNGGVSWLNENRNLPGSAIESAVVFVVGGEDLSGNALATCDYTNF